MQGKLLNAKKHCWSYFSGGSVMYAEYILYRTDKTYMFDTDFQYKS